MGEAFFYHMTTSTLDDTLRVLLPKSLKNGWRVELRCTRRDVLEALDLSLWAQPEDGFLPHGIAGGAHDAEQPVLLTLAGAGPVANDPACIMAVDGAPVSADEVAALQRVCILFDGRDDAALQQARDQWTTLREAGCGLQYWAQDGRRWEMKQKADAAG